MTYVIRGTVRDPAGLPVPGARAYFVGGPSAFPDVAALTDERGGFALSAPSRGTYELECSADGFAPRRIAIAVPEATEDGVDIRLDRA